MRSEHSRRHEELYSIQAAHRCLVSLSQLDGFKARHRGLHRNRNLIIALMNTLWPTNRSKRKHASHSSDPPPKAKEAAQMHSTAYTRRTGQQKPSTVLSSTFLTSERPTSSRGSSSTGNRTHGSPAALLQSHQETKPTDHLGGIASTGKRARELSTTTA
jgi:hypothetical protein